MYLKLNKLVLSLALFSFVMQAYSNNNLSTVKDKTQMTTQQLIDSTLSYIQHYDYEPLYMIYVESDASVNIKVNDHSIFSYFGIMSNGITAHINNAILQSGVQEVNIELYPSYIDKKTQAEYLTNQNKLTLTILKRHWEKDGGGLSEPEIVAKYDLQNEIRKNSLKLDKTNQFKDILKFKAEVPYVLTGWSKSKDLTKMKRKELEEKVVAFYAMYRSLYINKEANTIDNLLYKRELETSQAAYFDRDEVIKQKNGLQKAFDEYEFEMMPLENYEMQFFGNGRMVGLIRTDGRNRGQSTIRQRYTTKGGFRRIALPDLFLHIPEDGNELEVIR